MGWGTHKQTYAHTPQPPRPPPNPPLPVPLRSFVDASNRYRSGIPFARPRSEVSPTLRTGTQPPPPCSPPPPPPPLVSACVYGPCAPLRAPARPSLCPPLSLGGHAAHSPEVQCLQGDEARQRARKRPHPVVADLVLAAGISRRSGEGGGRGKGGSDGGRGVEGGAGVEEGGRARRRWDRAGNRARKTIKDI
jgi:uncharacterized membrane protein YgcG